MHIEVNTYIIFRLQLILYIPSILIQGGYNVKTTFLTSLVFLQ